MAKVSGVRFGLVAGGLMAALLTACGGGGGGSDTNTAATAAATPAPTPTLSGTFTDAPVAGAGYFTSSGSGGCVASSPCTTGAQGEFKYATGDAVTFMAAGFTLGTTPSLQPSADGSTTVTPVNLVAGATAATDPGPTAIAQFLQTVSAIAAGTTGSSAAGVLTMPTDTTITGKLSTALSSAGVTTSSSIGNVVAKLQSAMDTAFGINQFTVVPASTAQAQLTQGVNSNGIIGTVWSGTCTCDGGADVVTIYFQPDGTLTGFTSGGDLLGGSWVASTTSGGGVALHVTASEGYGAGSIAFNSSTGTITTYNDSGVVDGTLNLTKIVASGTSAATNTQYLGGWYATYTPNTTGLANGETGGTAYIVAAPDGSFYGITDGSSTPFKGTWTPADGRGTATWTDSQVIGISVDLANANGTVTVNGQAFGTLTLSRTGTLTRRNDQNSTATSGTTTGGTTTSTQTSTASTSTIPLALNVVVSWANTGGNAVTSLALGLNVYDPNGVLLSSGVKSESTAFRFDGVRTTSTDNIAVPYPKGSASTYSLSVGGASTCTMTGNSGNISDANSDNASAYPTVYVTCDPDATVTPIPLLLNVVTAWGTKYPAPGYGLALIVKSADGSQIATGFVQQNVNLLNVSGVVVAATTTTNIAASYPKGAAVTYALTTGSAYCTITGGSGGSVVDSNSGNAGAYPTISVICD